MRRRRSDDDVPGGWSRRAALEIGGMGLAGVLIGLFLSVGAGGYKWHLAEKAERLRTEGRPVTAQVSDFYLGSGRGGGADWVEVSYLLDGRQYRAKVTCGRYTGCVNAPGPEVTVLVDPKDPAEFLLQGGNPTGSYFFLNSWTLIPVGLVAAVVGTILLTITVAARRRAVAAAAAAGDGDVRPPKVRVGKGTWRRKRNKRKR